MGLLARHAGADGGRLMRAADSTLAARATWLATKAAGLVSPRLAGPIAARLWFTPWRVPISERAAARQAEWMAPTANVTFVAGGRRIAGYAAGSGPVILLVHGWGERAASLGAFFSPLVGQGYRVVAIDLPGHGASEGGQVDGFEIADAIREVREQAGDVRAVVAHSMGATTTLYAASQGLDVEALVLLAPSPRLDHALATFARMLSLPANAVTGLKATIERRYGPRVWHALSGDTVAAGVRIPALIVHDCDDAQVELEDARTLHAAWPGSRLLETQGLGHGRILRDPDVIGAVTSFLREVAPARPPATAGA